MTERYCTNPNCNISLTRKSQKKYCSSNCKTVHNNQELIKSWLIGLWDGSRKTGQLSSVIRNYLLAEVKYQCSSCGWNKINPTTNKVPLDIDHIDGNSDNNLPQNLRVLCPNCHSLTPTYKALNKVGRGTRAYRKKYNQFDLVIKLPVKNSASLICQCGNSKESTAKRCQNCYKIWRIQNANYPSKESMVLEIKEIGIDRYAVSLGKTANAVKKYLKKHGYSNSDLRKERKP